MRIKGIRKGGVLRSLLVRDFQRHRTFKVRLDPFVTTLVGPTDSGKSAVLRALRWVCQNRPGGDEFVRDNADFASVLLKVQGHRVERRKGSDRNLYILDGKKFSAFGKDVPEEVKRVLRLDEINFQGQHDSPFWFSESPSEVSQKLNEIVDLSLIDVTLNNLSKALRVTRTERGIVEERVEEAKKEREETRVAKEIDKDLSKLEKWHGVLECDLVRLEELERTIGSVRELRSSLRSSKIVLSDTEKDIKKVEKRVEELGRNQVRLSKLSDLLSAIEEKRISINELSRDLKTSEKKFQKEMGDSCALCGQSLPQ